MREVEDKPRTTSTSHKRAAYGEMSELDDNNTFSTIDYYKRIFNVRLPSERLGPKQLACLAGPVKKFYNA
ncbi:hypothetical protein [Alicyclobacillus pomorum]|jgi:hypothetical protein|uniref:hypothetical protein n=1 Tax=Alicyclobacillus pomorum TaxID=204470 RepID=UPI0004091213|nr:hypothetical protein [Alicyclobacillus pomorum]